MIDIGREALGNRWVARWLIESALQATIRDGSSSIFLYLVVRSFRTSMPAFLIKQMDN